MENSTDIDKELRKPNEIYNNNKKQSFRGDQGKKKSKDNTPAQSCIAKVVYIYYVVVTY